MTNEQWLFEYYAQAQKDRELAEFTNHVMKTATHIVRETLIGVFGLNLIHRADVDERREEDGEEFSTPFVPMSYLVGRPEIMKDLVEKYQKAEAAEKEIESPDEDFDAYSRELQHRLESGDYGDMEPIISDDYGTEEERAERMKLHWQSDDMQQMLVSLGVTPRSVPEELLKDEGQGVDPKTEIPGLLPPKPKTGVTFGE